MKQIKKGLIIFTALQILDLIFTYTSLVGKNPATELNPLYIHTFALFGILGGLIAIKCIGIIGVFSTIYWLMTKKDELMVINTWYIKFNSAKNVGQITLKMLKYINVVYVLIVINNIYWNLRNSYIL